MMREIMLWPSISQFAVLFFACAVNLLFFAICNGICFFQCDFIDYTHSKPVETGWITNISLNTLSPHFWWVLGEVEIQPISLY